MESTWLIGCEVIPDSNKALIGCGTGSASRKLYTWDMTGNVFTEEADCKHDEGHFSVQDSSTIIIGGDKKKLWRFTEENGYTKTGVQTTINHSIGDSFTLPSGTITCS